jgi:hypothetical protein
VETAHILTGFDPRLPASTLHIDALTALAGLLKRRCSSWQIADRPIFRACTCKLSGFNAVFSVIVDGVEYWFPYLLPHLLACHREEISQQCPTLIGLINTLGTAVGSST